MIYPIISFILFAYVIIKHDRCEEKDREGLEFSLGIVTISLFFVLVVFLISDLRNMFPKHHATGLCMKSECLTYFKK